MTSTTEQLISTADFEISQKQSKLSREIRLSMNVTLFVINLTGGQIANHLFERKCRTTIQNRGMSPNNVLTFTCAVLGLPA